MAEKKEKKKQDKSTKKGNFFLDLKTELKRVSWPDKQKLIRSSAAVFIISLAFALLIWLVDLLVSGGLNLVGFHEENELHKKAVNTPVPAVTEVVPAPVPATTSGK